ncbi:MAG: polysaccharide biosynthesis protein [Alphaproteobacteria bacterium]|nr:polysaccharide biosynthesis protein [Alphaproteobacteria bacterium]
MFAKKTLMITGGTGSFGNATLDHFLKKGIKEIRIFSRDEKKQDDMRIARNDSRLKFYLGDVRNRDSLNQAMRGVDFVFHAAALKQVPSCEFYPMEALCTNTLGTENVMEAAFANKVKRVVILSTDKAVYPINAMGMTKALAEKLAIAKSRTIEPGGTVFCITRYGNVMASRGSVIPIFIEQIKKGSPLTITDPEMTRFLMSLKESVDLVEYAMTHGEQGDIFVQKAPASTIEVLARALQELMGAKNATTQIIGTRHGEKTYESLISREEMVRAVNMGRYYRIPSDNRELNYAQYFVEGNDKIKKTEDYTSHNTKRLNIEEVKQLLLTVDYVQKQLSEIKHA